MICFPYGRPAAVAHVAGGSSVPEIRGTVSFFPSGSGTLVVADLTGLPRGSQPCGNSVFGFHIHEGQSCAGPDFAGTGGHFNPNGCDHPYHAGDLPPLFECDGRAYLSVLTGRFRVPDVIGRTVVVHRHPDDFHTQPSGASGEKIACGIIQPFHA